jgi:adenylate cyclase
MAKEAPINVLIVEQDARNFKALTTILRGSGNNFIHASSPYGALSVLRRQTIGIILLNMDHPRMDGFEFLDTLQKNESTRKIYTLIYADHERTVSRLAKGLQAGAVDFFHTPFNPNIIQAKFAVFNTLYLKDKRIDDLLRNILPQKVLKEIEDVGQFYPKRIDNAVVLFTDFVQFSAHTVELDPMTLVKELDTHFSYFDKVMDRFHLEKIKTIGDSYMALAGVNEDYPFPEIRAALAALEIRNYMRKLESKKTEADQTVWKIRIGLHAGPLVTGIIGNKKMNFDVWGDTVNIASRAEQCCEANEINITEIVSEKIKDYFIIEQLGSKEIVKRGGVFELHKIHALKNENSLFGRGNAPNSELRRRLGLTSMDFDIAREAILKKLKSSLPEFLYYHSLTHTLSVEKSAIQLAELEGVKGLDVIILRTAVLFHDTGYIARPDNNEEIAIAYATEALPNYGYTPSEIERITELIEATKHDIEPRTLLEQIICDADHDYLGRDDYHEIATTLRMELADQGRTFSEIEWIDFQLNYLENVHRFYTNSAVHLRTVGKQKRIAELYAMKAQNSVNP